MQSHTPENVQQETAALLMACTLVARADRRLRTATTTIQKP
ncbi:hypothetical protein [Prosthecobacter sp.]|nr:hypothetical protein [Prosthecobacter sp.]